MVAMMILFTNSQWDGTEPLNCIPIPNTLFHDGCRMWEHMILSLSWFHVLPRLCYFVLYMEFEKEDTVGRPVGLFIEPQAIRPIYPRHQTELLNIPKNIN